MEIQTRVFGDITIDDDRILYFPQGIVGFPELVQFTLLHDVDRGSDSIHWLQSIQEPAFAMPVMNPLYVAQDYDPQVEDEMLQVLGDLDPEEMLVFVTVTVPKDITQMSVNLKAPIIINAATRTAMQLIVEGEYPVRFPIYDILNAGRSKEDA